MRKIAYEKKQESIFIYTRTKYATCLLVTNTRKHYHRTLAISSSNIFQHSNFHVCVCVSVINKQSCSSYRGERFICQNKQTTSNLGTFHLTIFTFSIMYVSLGKTSTRRLHTKGKGSGGIDHLYLTHTTKLELTAAALRNLCCLLKAYN